MSVGDENECTRKRYECKIIKKVREKKWVDINLIYFEYLF